MVRTKSTQLILTTCKNLARPYPNFSAPKYFQSCLLPKTKHYTSTIQQILETGVRETSQRFWIRPSMIQMKHDNTNELQTSPYRSILISDLDREHNILIYIYILSMNSMSKNATIEIERAIEIEME
jgi:hypothetical protein